MQTVKSLASSIEIERHPMKKAPSIVVDESTSRRLKLGSLIIGNLGVIPQDVVDHLVTNEGREEIPDRLLRGFVGETPSLVSDSVASVKLATTSRHVEVVRETPKPCINRTVGEQVAGMQSMYEKIGWKLDVSGLIVPRRREGFDRLLVIGNTLTNNCVFDACKAAFPCWKYMEDLDYGIPTSERHPSSNGTYAVWFRDVVEADEDLKNLSADIIAKNGTKTITILERMVFELVHFKETGKHLDMANWTLCSGSRDSDGDVPDAYWGDGEFHVTWDYHALRDPNLRAREAVSL